MHPLDAPLAVGDGSLALGPRRGGRQDDVGDLAGRGQEDVLHDEQVEAAQQLLRVMAIGLGLQRVLADHVQRRELAALHGLEHPRQVPAALGRNAHAPEVVAALAGLVVLDVLEADQPVGQRAHVAAALDVVLAAERVDAAAVSPDVPGEQGERDQGEDVVDRVVVLGDPEGPADHRPVGLGVGVRGLADGLGRHAGLALRVLERVRLDGRRGRPRTPRSPAR